MKQVLDVQVLEDYRVKLKFDDGVERIVDLESELWGDVFLPLRDAH